MPACWSVSVLKRLLFEPLTALVMAVWGPSPVGVLVLAMKLPSLSWDSPAAGVLQLEPGGTTAAVTGGVATFHGNGRNTSRPVYVLHQLRIVQPVGQGRQRCCRAPELYGWSWMTLGPRPPRGGCWDWNSVGLARSIGQAFITTPIYFDVERNASRLRTTGLLAQIPDERGDVLGGRRGGSTWSATAGRPRTTFWTRAAALAVVRLGRRPVVDLLCSQIGERWRITETSLETLPFCRFGHGAWIS